MKIHGFLQGIWGCFEGMQGFFEGAGTRFLHDGRVSALTGQARREHGGLFLGFGIQGSFDLKSPFSRELADGTDIWQRVLGFLDKCRIFLVENNICSKRPCIPMTEPYIPSKEPIFAQKAFC